MQANAFSLKGKVAAITGGASGIGLAMARRFRSQGAAVEILDVDEAAARRAADEIGAEGPGVGAEGPGVGAEGCDVTDPASVEAAFSAVVKRHGRLDILVNNAGIAHVGNALTTTPEDFDRILRVNVTGVANCTREALRHMTEQRSGVIINIASTVAELAAGDRFAYSTSKGAVLAMTWSVAKDFIGHGIRCNAIIPARIHTPFVDGFIAQNYPGREAEMFEKLSVDQPIGRMGEPDEVAVVAVFLASDEASFITGAAYPVDGGKLHLH
jgi:2-keto-3-deoxy-L-fuconate dehydrogenase